MDVYSLLFMLRVPRTPRIESDSDSESEMEMIRAAPNAWILFDVSVRMRTRTHIARQLFWVYYQWAVGLVYQLALTCRCWHAVARRVLTLRRAICGFVETMGAIRTFAGTHMRWDRNQRSVLGPPIVTTSRYRIPNETYPEEAALRIRALSQRRRSRSALFRVRLPRRPQ